MKKNELKPNKHTQFRSFYDWSKDQTTLTRVNKLLKEQLQALAKSQDKKLYQLLNQAIEDYLKLYDKTKP